MGPEPVYMIWRRENFLGPPMIQTQYCAAYSLVTVQAFLSEVTLSCVDCSVQAFFREDTLSCVDCYLHNY